MQSAGAIPRGSLLRSERPQSFRVWEGAQYAILALSALVVVVPILLIAWFLVTKGAPAISWEFLTQPPRRMMKLGGIQPAIVGTLSSAFLALIFAVPVAIGAAIFLTELSPGWLRLPATYVIETLASIPSVIFGLWALFILVPFVREQIQPFFIDYFSWIPVFDGPAFGISIFAAGLILAVMILPIVTSITREILIAVPNSQ